MTPTGRSKAWPLRRIVALAVAVLLVIVSTSVAALASGPLKPRQDRFNVGAWELHRFTGKFLYGFNRLFYSHPSIEQENATLTRFFQLTREIDALEAAQSEAEARGQPRDPTRSTDLDAKRRERGSLQRESGRILQGRITKVLEDEGITRSALVAGVVWPPVSFDFAEAPRMLAVSPRDRIFLKRQELLQEGLGLTEIQAIETETEKREDVAARAFPLGGFGAYPSLIDYGDDYLATLQVSAHEWTHNYLFFRPLGFNYSKNNDLTTMNETVADLMGHEVAAEVVRRWPLATPAPAATPATTGTEAQPRLDVTAELRKLRGEVDALLGQGKVPEAEALMDQRQQELAAKGVYIRKINQAYFAFLNLYAGSAGNGIAVNPIGPKIDQLRQRSKSLRAFVDTVGNLTSVKDLDRALEN